MITPGLAFIAWRHAAWLQNSGPRQVGLERLVEAGLVDAERGRRSTGSPRRCSPGCRARRSARSSPARRPRRRRRRRRWPHAPRRPRRAWPHGSRRPPPPARRSCRDTSITLAPDAAIVAAIALPMPFDAPVTSATLPSNVICMGARLTHGRDRRCSPGAGAAPPPPPPTLPPENPPEKPPPPPEPDDCGAVIVLANERARRRHEQRVADGAAPSAGRGWWPAPDPTRPRRRGRRPMRCTRGARRAATPSRRAGPRSPRGTGGTTRCGWPARTDGAARPAA